jgi:hypothetical protein
MSELVLSYRPDPGDDYAWLTVSLTTLAFSGTGGFWVQPHDSRAFAVSLLAYPIVAGSEPRADWGFNRLEGTDRIISIQISPANPRGTLRADVEIADKDDRDYRVRSASLTQYSEIEVFSRALIGIASGQQETAILVGE